MEENLSGELDVTEGSTGTAAAAPEPLGDEPEPLGDETTDPAAAGAAGDDDAPPPLPPPAVDEVTAAAGGAAAGGADAIGTAVGVTFLRLEEERAAEPFDLTSKSVCAARSLALAEELRRVLGHALHGWAPAPAQPHIWGLE